MNGLPLTESELRRIVHAWSPERNDSEAAPVVLHLASELQRTRDLLKRVYSGCPPHVALEGLLADLGLEIEAWRGTPNH
jgi:hypothetical protein